MAETVAQADEERDTAPPAPRGRRGRRTALIASAVVVVALVAVVGALGLGGGGDNGPKAPARSGSLVVVVRTSLAQRTEVDGQLGYGTEIPLPVKATGTVTWLPKEGVTVRRGDTLLRVDDRPVVLMYGTLPMYRDLGLTPAESNTASGGQGAGTQQHKGGAGPSPASSGSPGSGDGGTGADTSNTSDTSGTSNTSNASNTAAAQAAPRELTGMDVLQFEGNLAALGGTGFTVDEHFTALTAQAVKRWQKSLGLPQTGSVGVGDVIYESGPIRIGHAGVRPGAPAGADVLTFTGTSRKVIVNASAADAAWAVRGASVEVGLPNGQSVQGKVASVGRHATAAEGDGGGDGGGSGGANATVPVTITIRDQKALGQLESGPVTVEYVGREAKDVLAVPVSALVALAGGGYGLETGDGRYVRVKTGLFADGNVEVSGPAVRAGMKVRVPE